MPKDKITIRANTEIFESFRAIAIKNNLSQADMFKELILKYGASKQGKRIIDLQKAHSQLVSTCSLLEKQLFEVFQQYDNAASELEIDQSEVANLQAENKKLYSLVLDLQGLAKEKDKEFAAQKSMLEFLTEEIEKLQNKGAK
jgi:peptidoglycan hydrolase CwlO-like protein